MGKPPRSATVDQAQVIIGRDPSCHVVLNNASVSRQHAVVQLLQDGRWACQALKDENPLVVDGQITVQTRIIGEGAQLQIGRFFVIFSLESVARQDYMSDQKQYEAVCQGCDWKGVLSAVARAPACPKCGGDNFMRADDLASSVGQGSVLSGPTAYLRPEDLQKMHDRINQAKHARIERLTPGPGLPAAYSLSETEACVFGKKGQSNMAIDGFMFGAPAQITWERTHYVIRKGGLLPGLKVNGEKVTDQALKEGDQIALGKNRFRFTVG